MVLIERGWCIWAIIRMSRRIESLPNMFRRKEEGPWITRILNKDYLHGVFP
jgi:hypothetical protein